MIRYLRNLWKFITSPAMTIEEEIELHDRMDALLLKCIENKRKRENRGKK